jgi:osmotically-inducible protein OsmY
MVAPAALGAGLMFFLDPARGERRRNMTMDRLGALFRRLGSQTEKKVKFVGGHAYGIVQETVPHRRDNPDPDDLTLRDRVETEIFRDRETSRERINVDVVEHGIVELRGELPHQEDIDDLIDRVKSIPDVREVHSYLHLPGTPAPNKQSVLRVPAS